MPTLELTIRRLPVRKINPAPYNPRLDLNPGDPESARLERSLDEVGLVEPLVWNKRTTAGREPGSCSRGW